MIKLYYQGGFTLDALKEMCSEDKIGQCKVEQVNIPEWDDLDDLKDPLHRLVAGNDAVLIAETEEDWELAEDIASWIDGEVEFLFGETAEEVLEEVGLDWQVNAMWNIAL